MQNVNQPIISLLTLTARKQPECNYDIKEYSATAGFGTPLISSDAKSEECGHGKGKCYNQRMLQQRLRRPDQHDFAMLHCLHTLLD